MYGANNWFRVIRCFSIDINIPELFFCFLYVISLSQTSLSQTTTADPLSVPLIFLSFFKSYKACRSLIVRLLLYLSFSTSILHIYIIYIFYIQAHRNRGERGCSPPRFLLPFIFHELKKIVLKWKNSIKLKPSWNSSKVTDISNTAIDLDTRDDILSVIYRERSSHF